jgi:hypothetical protein
MRQRSADQAERDCIGWELVGYQRLALETYR